MSEKEYFEALEKRTVQEGLEIMESLGFKNTPMGMATDITPVTEWRKLGLACAFEHCILSMPEPIFLVVNGQPVNLMETHPGFMQSVCPRFKRVCPAGVLQVIHCFPPEQQKAEKPEGEEAVQAEKGEDSDA
jgi:hypothetical protein